MKSGNLNFLEPSGPLQAFNGTALPFYICNLEILISSNFNVYHNDNIQKKYRRGKKITIIYQAFDVLKGRGL
jgi:hypothetical protein